MQKQQPFQLSDEDKILDIRYDPIFKAVFTRETPGSRGALSSLISACIGRIIAVETIVANEPPVSNTGDRQIRYDISCKAETGEHINIEMTLFPEAEEQGRLELFAARLFARQDLRGSDKSYADLQEAFQIAIVGNTRLYPDDSLIHRFRYYDEENNVAYNSKESIITMELSKASRLLDKPMGELGKAEAWAVYLEYLTDETKRSTINGILKQEEGIAMASEEMKEISQDFEEWARLESRVKYEMDMQSRRVRQERAERKLKEMEAEISEKEAQIAQKDTEIADNKAEITQKDTELAQKNAEIARKLKGEGVSWEIISRSSGLSLEEIATL